MLFTLQDQRKLVFKKRLFRENEDEIEEPKFIDLSYTQV
jgi:hypothetical protein